MAAGDSADHRSRELEREARRLHSEAMRYATGASGEKLVAAALQPLTEWGWTLLEDRYASARSKTNIDLIAVGPGGIVVIDAKNWQVRPRLVNGVLMHGATPCADDVDRLVAATRRVQTALQPLGLSPVAVRSLMIFAGQSVDLADGPVRLVGSHNAGTVIARLPVRLTPHQVSQIANRLDDEFPQHRQPVIDVNYIGAQQLTLVDVYDMMSAHAEAARRGPIEEWMTYLNPVQNDLVRRNFGGPARISGNAGTGKTVVALHRAIHTARQGYGRVLLLTFVRSLATVQSNLLARIDPEAAKKIDVRTVHGFATWLLGNRGNRPPDEDDKTFKKCFDQAWATVDRRALSRIDPKPGYWRDEITYVIKGRGFATLDDYLDAERHGRRTPLQAEHRKTVWDLYLEYERLLRARSLIDFADRLQLALASVHRQPLSKPYAAVIVDESQDLSLTGLRFVHALAGDGPNGLLLLGDARQSVYPGGYLLADADLQIRGARSVILRTNHRNGRRILETATRLLQGAVVEDVDGTTMPAADDVELTRGEGKVIHVKLASRWQVQQALVQAVVTLPEHGDAALLCSTNDEVKKHENLLRQYDVPTQNLEKYDGLTNDTLKIGTFARAKGLDFKTVLLPEYDRSLQRARAGTATDDDHLTRATNELYVAILRARDNLWLATVDPGRHPETPTTT
jgi:hypothetical protein